MIVSSNIYDMHLIYEHCHTLMTWWFPHTYLIQNEIMPLLHGTLQLYFKLICNWIMLMNWGLLKLVQKPTMQDMLC